MPLDGRELLADRLGIDPAHQAPDVLHLAALCLMAFYAFCRDDGLVKIAFQGKLAELRLRERNQRRAQRLQRMHFLLAFRFADDFVLHRAVS